VGKIIVSCARDNDLARRIYDYLQASLDNLTLDEDQIEITKASRRSIANLLDAFIKSNPDLKDYSVIEFGDTFTVGMMMTPDKVGMHSCELCGYFTPYAEELYTHRMTHIGGFG
jgi:hypothetical protein